jgi:hypothetical protein
MSKERSDKVSDEIREAMGKIEWRFHHQDGKVWSQQ